MTDEWTAALCPEVRGLAAGIKDVGGAIQISREDFLAFLKHLEETSQTVRRIVSRDLLALASKVERLSGARELILMGQLFALSVAAGSPPEEKHGIEAQMPLTPEAAKKIGLESSSKPVPATAVSDKDSLFSHLLGRNK